MKRLDLTIRLVPATESLKSAVKSTLVSLFQTLAPGGLLYLSHLRATVSNVIGETDNSILSLQSDIQLERDQILVLGNITWQT